MNASAMPEGDRSSDAPGGGAEGASLRSQTALARVGATPRSGHQGCDVGQTARSTRTADSGYDPVIGLREWGDGRVFSLSAPREVSEVDAVEAGAVDAAPALQLTRSGFAAASDRLEIVREGALWRIRDRSGAANLRQDGRAASEASLIAGTEVTIASRTFIAESARSLALRGFCCRLLGWGRDRVAAVEQALRAIRLAGSGRVPLILTGSGDLVPIAQAIHRYTCGPGAPFVVSDPRRGDAQATIRSPTNCRSCTQALQQAQGGTLCVRLRCVPWDFERMLESYWQPANAAQLLLCATGKRPLLPNAAQIDIPSLQLRSAEWPRILHESIEDASHALDAPGEYLDDDEQEWILRCATIDADPTVVDIEKAASRVIAIKLTDTVADAARVLGMAPVSLDRWLRRRWVDMLASSGGVP